jgi:hypothetical protein
MDAQGWVRWHPATQGQVEYAGDKAKSRKERAEAFADLVAWIRTILVQSHHPLPTYLELPHNNYHSR